MPDSDVLGRWMAHHISDLIIKAENATGEQALELGRETADTIIRLWAHRSAAPLRSRPTEALDPVSETLVRLEQDKPWRFYGMFPADNEPDDDTTRTTLLRFALELEETVREVVRHIIVVAAEQAADKEAKWLRLAEHLAEDEQRHRLNLIRRMERRMRAKNTDPAATDDANEHTQSIEALHKGGNAPCRAAYRHRLIYRGFHRLDTRGSPPAQARKRIQGRPWTSSAMWTPSASPRRADDATASLH